MSPHRVYLPHASRGRKAAPLTPSRPAPILCLHTRKSTSSNHSWTLCPPTEFMHVNPDILAAFRRQVTSARSSDAISWDASRQTRQSKAMANDPDIIDLKPWRHPPFRTKSNAVSSLSCHRHTHPQKAPPRRRAQELTGLPPTKALRALCVLLGIQVRPRIEVATPHTHGRRRARSFDNIANPFDLLAEHVPASVLDLGAGDLSFAEELVSCYAPRLATQGRSAHPPLSRPIESRLSTWWTTTRSPTPPERPQGQARCPISFLWRPGHVCPRTAGEGPTSRTRDISSSPVGHLPPLPLPMNLPVFLIRCARRRTAADQRGLPTSHTFGKEPALEVFACRPQPPLSVMEVRYPRPSCFARTDGHPRCPCAFWVPSILRYSGKSCRN